MACGSEDYATGPLGFNAGCVYMAAQVFQIYLTATFVPVMEEDTFSVVQELIKVRFTPLAATWRLSELAQRWKHTGFPYPVSDDRILSLASSSSCSSFSSSSPLTPPSPSSFPRQSSR